MSFDLIILILVYISFNIAISSIFLHVVGGSTAELLENCLLGLFADMGILQFDLKEGGKPLDKSEDCLIGDTATVLKIDAL